MAGVLLGPYAAIPAAVGSGLADLLGYGYYLLRRDKLLEMPAKNLEKTT